MSDVRLTNPATGEEIAVYGRTTADRVEAALATAEAKFFSWRSSSADDRAAVLRRLGDALERDAAKAAETITREMGKPITQSRGEVAKCVALCRHYADDAGRYLEPSVIQTEANWSAVRFDPLGVVLGIMPWNFPYWQVFRWGVPTLLAGNTLVLKHADNVLGAAAHMAELFEEAEPDLLQNLCLANDEAESLIADPRVRGVSLTGSVRAGRAVGAAAGRALKPSVLELGGSDAALVLPDADLEADLDAIVNGRFQNSGQTCVATKRYLVHADIAEDFTERFVAAVERLSVGDPTQDATDVGPMARGDLRETLTEQTQRCEADGLRVAVRGGPVDADGFFFRPTVLTGGVPDSTPFREELFGPVAVICECDGLDQMIDWANATDYGLSASVWTAETERASHVASRLDVGCVFFNASVKSDARLPFGGVKDSGYGRELGGLGVRQFCNEKAVWVA